MNKKILTKILSIDKKNTRKRAKTIELKNLGSFFHFFVFTCVRSILKPVIKNRNQINNSAFFKNRYWVLDEETNIFRELWKNANAQKLEHFQTHFSWTIIYNSPFDSH